VMHAKQYTTSSNLKINYWILFLCSFNFSCFRGCACSMF
jgi:hypothetical protein